MKTAIGLIFLFTLVISWHTTMAGKDKPELASFLIPEDLKDNANAVVRNSDYTFEISSEGRTYLTAIVAITILNRNGENFASLKLGYSNYSIIMALRASIYDAFGNHIRDHSGTEISDYSDYSAYSMFSDNRVKHLELTYSKYPYTIEFHYKVGWRGLIDYPEWEIQSREKLSIEHSSYTIIAPNDFQFKYYCMNIELTPTVNKHKNKIHYFWEVKNLTAIKTESYSPPLLSILPILHFTPVAFKIGKHRGSTESWESLGRFTYELNAGRDLLDPNSVAEIKKLIRYDKTNLEKTRTLYKYLQESTRYVSIQIGIGGLQCFEAEFVHRNKYGDCKALTNYMKTLLRTAGIGSYVARIKSGNKVTDLKKEFPANQFNHWILCIPDQGDTIWLECTSQYDPAGYLGRSTRGRHALLITPEGGVLVRTPPVFPEDNQQIRNAEVFLDEQGNAAFEVTTYLTGYQFSRPNFIAIQNDQDKTKEWLQGTLDIPSATITGISFHREDENIPEISADYEMQIRNIVARTKSRIFLKPNFYDRISKLSALKKERKYPVFNNYPYLDIDTITFYLPSGYSIENINDYPVAIDSDFGNYFANCTFSSNNDTLTYIRHLRFNSFNMPAEKYKELELFTNEIAKAENNQIVFRKEE